MNGPLALIGLFALLISHVQLSTADCDNSGNFKSNSGEAQCRKDHAPDTVKRKPPPTASPAPTQVFEWDCILVEALHNASLLLTVDEQFILEEFIEMIQVTILMDDTLTDIEKVVECSYALKHFFKDNDDIKKVIHFKGIPGFGSFFDFDYVSVDLQADFIESVVALDGSDDCDLFDSILNATSNDTQMYQASKVLVEQMRVVLKSLTWTHGQKMAQLHKLLKKFFDKNPTYKDFFMKIKIKGFGNLESFDDVTQGYERALTISVVLVGSSDSDSPILKALSDAVANTSFTITVRNQIKQFHDKLAAYFATEKDNNKRMVYFSQQYWQLIIMEPFIVEYMTQVSIVDLSGNPWGILADLTWVSQFCNNTGSCGCMSCGLGTADCSSRVNLIAVTAQNTTQISDVVMANYKIWNTTTQLGFNTYKNYMIQCIWNNTAYPKPAQKVNALAAYFSKYNANNVYKQQVLFNITIDVWNGIIADFVNCPNMTVI